MNNNRLRKFTFPLLRTACKKQLKNLMYAGIALLLVTGLGFADTIAQDRVTINGVVTDAQDESPLPGVTITVPGSDELTGTTIGTTTNLDGEYTVRVPEGLNELRFSFIGYDPLVVQIDGRTEINVQLQQDVRLLDDVVVVGYGVQDRREITSSVSSVSADEFVTGNINNAQQLLQGKVPGLIISKRGADPEGGFDLRLRGLSSLGADKEPLVVVDGIIGASFNNIDPNDIQSIDVLKDASASAIYGTRGSGGVILITTKSGGAVAEDGISVEYRGQATTSFVANQMEMLNAEEYRDLPNRIPGTAISDLGGSTNWMDEVTQNAFTQSHNLAIAGGDANTTYRVSGNFRDIQGIQRGTSSQRLNTRLNITHRALNDRLQLNGTLALTDRNANVGNDNVFRYATTHNPTATIFNEDGTYREISGFDRFNPVAINELNTRDSENRDFNIALRGEYDFSNLTDGLSASGFYSRQSSNSFYGEYRSKRLDWGDGIGRNGLAFRENNESTNQLIESTVNYRNSFDWVRVESVAGYSYQEFEFQGNGMSGGDFPSDATLYHNFGLSGDFSEGRANVWSYRNTNKLIAFFGRTNFTFDNTYFLSGTYRREGSTRFGEGNKWGDFFAASAGVELTNLIDVPRADELKLRISYGETGQNAPESGLSRLQFGTGSSFLVGGNFVPSISPQSNPNPNLKWEVKREWNFGADFAFFNNRLNGSVDYYDNVTDDLLLEFGVPVPPNLFPFQWVNIGQLSNRGFEAALSYVAIQNQDVTWSTGVTFSTQETILESLSTDELQFGDRRLISNVGSPGLNDTQMVRVQEGRPIGELWGKEFAGFNQDGQWLFYDKDGNTVTSGETTSDDDRVIGNGMPDFQLGIDNTFRFRNWDLNMFWSGAFGHDLANTFRIFYENPTQAPGWNVTRSTLDVPELNESPQFSSFHVEDASFMRLENLTIGYSFNLPATAPVRDLRFYVSGNNLWTITNYSGIDPQVRFEDFEGTGGLEALAPGIERRNQWFTQTSLVFGVNLAF
ncbi:TonB-dependent receptor [soil metagenome]